MDLVIAGNAYIRGRLEKCCIGIENGKIAAIKKILKGHRSYDFGDKLILPGGIDIHVHFRDPGLTHKEDFETGSLSAAFGGITCVIDMPNTLPPVIDEEALKDKTKFCQRKTYIDFGLYSAITSQSDLTRLAPHSTGFKLYMGETTGKLTFQDMNELGKKLGSLKKGAPKVLAVHAEAAEALSNGASKVPDDEYKDLKAHSRRRPDIAEVNAIKDITVFHNRYFEEETKIGFDGRFHICHISSEHSLIELKNNPGLSSEVTPHHLFLSAEANSKLGSFGKVNPPIRSEDNRIKLWQSFCSGEIPIIASDHAPHTQEEKELPFDETPSGLPGVECILPLLLSQMKHDNITLDRIVDATAVKPAKLFGFEKGHLEVGSDADLIVVDLRHEVSLKTKMLHSKCEWTPYENMSVIFPRMTVSRGNIVTKDDGVEGEPGSGKYLSGK